MTPQAMCSWLPKEANDPRPHHVSLLQPHSPDGVLSLKVFITLIHAMPLPPMILPSKATLSTGHTCQKVYDMYCKLMMDHNAECLAWQWKRSDSNFFFNPCQSRPSRKSSRNGSPCLPAIHIRTDYWLDRLELGLISRVASSAHEPSQYVQLL